MGRPYTDSLEAWEKFMRGLALYLHFKKEDNAKAQTLFEEATVLDRQFARAFGLLAGTHRQDWTFAWTEDRAASMRKAFDNAQTAVNLAGGEPEPKPSLPYALQQLAYVLLYKRDYQAAQEEAAKAVQRNPNYADGYSVLAQVLIYRPGQTRYAIDRLEIAKRLNPKYPAFYDFQLGQAYYVLGVQTQDPDTSRQYYQLAEGHLRVALGRNKNYRSARTYLVAVLWKLGRQAEAKEETNILIRTLDRLSSQHPEFEEYVRETHPYEEDAIITDLIQIWKDAEQP